PYPTVGDITLSLCLLPAFFHFLRCILFPRDASPDSPLDRQVMKLGFVIANTFMFVSFLGPVLYYLWVETGTGNSNFFYAVTLAYAIAASLLVSETIGLALQWDYTSKHRLPMFPSPSAAPPQPV